MEFSCSNGGNSEPTRSVLVLDLNEVPSSSSPETLPPDALSVVRTFQDELNPPAGAAAELPQESRGSACGACGRPEVQDYVVVCDGCERGFHLGCAGMLGPQVVLSEEWMCGECGSNSVKSNRWQLGSRAKRKRCGVPLLDINSLPPSDGEGEGSEDSLCSRKRTPGDNSFHGNPFGVPVTYSNSSHVANGFDFHKASDTVMQPFKLGSEDISNPIQTRFGISGDRDFCSPFEGRKSRKNTSIRFLSQDPRKMHLQALREYILERHGAIGEGWCVEYRQSIIGGIYPVYCAPDGKIFESMSDVACYLGLASNTNAVELETRSYGSTSSQKQLHLSKRRKTAKHLVTNGVAETKGTQMSGLAEKQPSSSQYRDCDNNVRDTVKAMCAEPIENSGSDHPRLNDLVPIQFEDFFILSLGNIDARSSYHNVNQILPLGYRSCWHDIITGSLFMCDVLDGGDAGPIYKVKRLSCSALPLPNGSTVISKAEMDHQFSGQHTETIDDVTPVNMDYDEDFSVLMMLSEPSPPKEHDILSCLGSRNGESFSFHAPNSCHLDTNSLSEKLGDDIPDHLVLSNAIGEFSVEESSSSLAWRMVTKKLLDICHNIYIQTGTMKFFCKHFANGTCSPCGDVAKQYNEEKLLSLAKYCGLSYYANVPFVFRGDFELDALFQELVKWLDQDRFGLDLEFVQEILEHLPGVQACSLYVFLTERSNYSSSATIGNRFMQAKTKDGVQVNDSEALAGLLGGCETAKSQMVEDPVIDNSYLPPGKPIGSRLPSQTIGDVIQVCEFFSRFHAVLGFKEPFSFEELEGELVTAWSGGLNLIEKYGRRLPEGQHTALSEIGTSGRIFSSSTESDPAAPVENPHAVVQLETGGMKEACQVQLPHMAYSRCTGFVLSKAYKSLLKVLIGELQSKVAAVVHPHFDNGESKSKRGRKKETDSLIAVKGLKLNMLPLNEWTWPELARRYVLAVLSMDGNLDSAEIITRESAKVFRCLQGDGGLLCGSLAGVVGIEADALLLAEATKKIFGSLNRDNDVLTLDDDRSDGTSCHEKVSQHDGVVPEWAQSLEPVRKLPTNVGARIRKCVNDALEKNPPEWAKKILEHSISKEVYKGNASGPTKKAVLSVLADVTSEGLKPNPDRETKQKRFISISDLIMKQCRVVLRHAAAADDAKVFCNLLGKTLIKCNDNDDEGILGPPAMVARPLDFRTIDLRLATGAYGASHEAFLEDVRELWINLSIAFADQPDLVQLAETLSHNFESLYEKEVVTLFQRLVAYTKSEHSSVQSKDIDDLLVSVQELPKAPWEEGVCKVCGIDKDDVSVLLCDTCDAEYHTYCLNPPLARIPEGNWYCPSCITSKNATLDASQGTRVNSQLRKKYQGETTREYLDNLTQLAAVVEEKEYWELSIEERIFLLKFLSDELLNSALIRQHLEHCLDETSDLQQKLRSLSIEWKALKNREEILSMEAAKINRRVVEEERGPYAVFTDNDKRSEWQHVTSDKHSYSRSFSDDPSQLEGGQKFIALNMFNEHSPISNSKQFYSGDSQTEDQSKEDHAVVGDFRLPKNPAAHVASLENAESSNKIITLCRENTLSGNMDEYMGKDVHTLTASEDLHGHFTTLGTANYVSDNDGIKKSGSDSLDLISLRNEISSKRNLISSIEAQIMKLSLRRELLGIDSFGRLYWVLAKSGSRPWLVVNGDGTLQQAEKTKSRGYPNSSDMNAPHVDNHILPCPWVSYETEAEIDKLKDFLEYNDPNGRELKESILLWKRSRFNCFGRSENQDDGEPRSNFESASCLVTKAANLLETKYGPCVEPEVNDCSKKLGRKGKISSEEKMYRCECLEPVWPARQHCLSCHRTFDSEMEFKGHLDGKCSPVLPVSEKSKEYNNAYKGKGIKSETSREECARETNTIDASRSGFSELSPGLIQYQNDGLMCPFDFDEICSKLVFQNSNKELVQEIGLIGSNGIPSFVSAVPPYLSDPTLMSMPPEENGGVQFDHRYRLAFLEGEKTSNDGGPVSMHYNNHPRGDEQSEVMDDGKSGLRCLEQKHKKPSLHAPTMEGVNCCVVPQASLRPLSGKASQILSQLKINLLDMDAALPAEAFRPSRANLERRCMWRTFVKLAETIYKMVQAIIVFEDMIKTEYLNNMWWYWSSLSAAAKTSTLSSLALRIYSLDTAIDYEKVSSDSRPVEPISSMTYQKRQPSLDATEKSKQARKTNKKRKETEE